MYSSRIIAKRCFTSFNNRIVCMANSNTSDLAGARFMKALEKVSNGEKFEYYGYGGHRMLSAGLGTSEYDINNFSDKEFYTWRKTKTVTEGHFAMRWTSWNLVNAHYKRNADDILSDLEDASFIKSCYRHRPSVILSFDNEYFSMQMMEKLSKYYYKSSVPLPSRHYYNRFIKDMRNFHEKYFDYMHYTIPKRTALPDGYFFPGQYVGQHGVYDTIRHLLSSDPEQKHLVHENTVSLSKKYSAGDIESAIQKAKAKFRSQHKIDEDATVIFFAPGNEKKEALFSYEAARRGVEEFLLKYSSPTSLSPIAKPLDKFHTIISVEENSVAEQIVRDMLEKHGWKGEYTVVTNHGNEYIDAMASSDLAIIYDGQMIGQAAACHLPTMILLEMRMHHQWYHDLFNRWYNSMITISDKDIYPELIGGQAWFGKICDTLGEWYLQPEIRYDMVREWEFWVKDAMHKVNGRAPASVAGDNELVFHDGKEYDQFADTFHLMAQKVWEDVNRYDSEVGIKNIPMTRRLHKSIPHLF